jgi:hypothetical protein
VLPAVNNVSFTVRACNRRPFTANPQMTKKNRGGENEKQDLFFFRPYSCAFFCS